MGTRSFLFVAVPLHVIPAIALHPSSAVNSSFQLLCTLHSFIAFLRECLAAFLPYGTEIEFYRALPPSS